MSIIFNWIHQKIREKRELQKVTNDWLQIISKDVTDDDLLSIPVVTGCIERITNIIASIPIELFNENGDSVKLVQSDRRVLLLNDYTGDTLNGFDLKKAMTFDYLVYGSGFAFINRQLNDVRSIHYVDKRNISSFINQDPIFKRVTYHVNGKEYRECDFIKILRRTKNGADGIGILKENNQFLTMMYHALQYEQLLVSSGGNKKGFVKSKTRLSENAMTDLKEQWNNMYANNHSNCVILNDGLDFQESSNTSVEMQLVENKKVNTIEICNMLGVPEKVLNGTCTDEEYQSFIKLTILPLLAIIESALNVALLSNTERDSFYFKFNTKELMKTDIEKRYKAYGEAVRTGIMQIDEVRYNEDLPPLGLDFIKLGLQDVLYNPKTKEIYTPNTNQTANVSDLKEGEKDKNRDKIE